MSVLLATALTLSLAPLAQTEMGAHGVPAEFALSDTVLAVAPVLAPTPTEILTPGTATGPFKLRFDPVGDGLMTGFGAALWVTTEAVTKDLLAPPSCRVCDQDPDGTDRLNPIDRWGRKARWALEDQHTADTLSNVTGFAILPLGLTAVDVYLAHDNGVLPAARDDLVIIAKSTVFALVLNQAVKFTVGRERPFVHALPPGEKRLVSQPTDNNLSFFSGHSTFAFSLTVAAGTIAELRSYEGRALVWAVGLPLAATTAYLRMAADKHYLSDVLVGAGVGTLFGVAVPLLFHPREGRFNHQIGSVDVDLIPSANGATLVGRF